jgi:hypothetical protein
MSSDPDNHPVKLWVERHGDRFGLLMALGLVTFILGVTHLAPPSLYAHGPVVHHLAR